MAQAKEKRAAEQASAAVSKKGTRSAAASVGAPVSLVAEEIATLVIPQWLQQAHPSHNIYYVGGMFICSLCGSSAAIPLDKSHRLRAECRGTMPLGSTSRARKLLRGLLVPPLVAWPDGLKEPSDRRAPLRLVHTSGGFGFS